MDNFILSSKVGDKWTKVTSDMTSVKLGTCIHIMGKLISGGIIREEDLTNGTEGGGGGTIRWTIVLIKSSQ
jgi:hypothetical protein